MRNLEEKLVNLSTLVGSQFPSFVSQTNQKFIGFLSSYYESLETKYQPLDIIKNLIEYYNIKNYTATDLVNNTELTAPVGLNDTVLQVKSTKGFPDKNGYIKINGEIIFYRTKTLTTFDSCVRGTSAFVLETVPSTNVILTNSEINLNTNTTVHSHSVGDSVDNIAYTFTAEFLRRITAELSPDLPQNLVSDLNLTNFLSQVKSFYTAKGSLNSHKILFRILFNDKKIKIRVKNRGTGAKLKLTNYEGSVGFLLPEIFKTTVGSTTLNSTTITLNSVDEIEVNDEVILTTSNAIQSETIVLSKNIANNTISINRPIISSIPAGTQLKFVRVVGYSVEGGQDYDNRKDSYGRLINDPVIEVLGSGTGTKDSKTNIIPKTAIIKATDINSQGAITKINVFNRGINYIGPISARVRERTFTQDQIVYNASGTGSGRVEFWDAGSNELTLYNTVGYFKVDDELIGEGFESPRAFISKAYPRTDINRKGNPSVQVISLEPEVEFPKDHTIKPSSSTYYGRKVIHAQLIKNTLYEVVNNQVKIPKLISLIQESDLESGIKGANLEISTFANISKNVYSFDIESNFDYKNIVSVPSTKVVIQKSLTAISGVISDVVLTVDDATGFPLRQGYIYVDGRIFVYDSRSSNQFFNCTYIGTESSFTIPVGTELYAYGRKKCIIPFQSNQLIKEGDSRYIDNRLYTALNSGYTTSSAPIHTTGQLQVDKILWRYDGENDLQYFLKAYFDGNFDNPNPAELIPLGLISDITVNSSGSLYSSRLYEFDSTLKNTKVSPVYTSWSINYTNTITDNSLASYQNTTGINSLYEYENHVYITSSGIPKYLQSITGRKHCTNQKLLKRISTYVEKGKGVSKLTTKNIGTTIDGVEIQSSRGNSIRYGHLEKIYIGNIGNYKVPISSASNYTQFNYEKYPVILLEGSTDIISNTSGNTLFYISSGLTSVDISKLDPSYLSGFISKPVIEIINNNPSIINNFTQSNIDTFFSTLNINNHKFSVGDKVTYTSTIEEIGELKNNFVYYVGQVTTNSFKLYFSKEDADLGGNNFVSFRNNYTTLVFSATLRTDIRNPANFEQIDLDLSYDETTKTVDNIIIKNTGRGYLVAPTIKISGGGKATQIIPLASASGDIFTFRGGLISALNFDKPNKEEINVNGLISTIFSKTPNLTISAGSNASFTVYTTNGRISSSPIDNSGSYYFTEPNITVQGIGTGAVLKAINDVNTGRVNSIEIVNSGSGYSLAPVVRITPSGSGGTASAELRLWTFNLSNRLTLDNYGGYVFSPGDDDAKTTNGLTFQELTKNNIPSALGDSQYLILKTSSNFNTEYQVNSAQHSKIIGWAYDGNPIYGKYAYSSKFNSTSSIVEMTSSWKLKTARVGGPTISQYPLGTFIEDYEYVSGFGTLDQYNGRYCITPEFPDGTYAYFAVDAFPYFIGLEFYSTLDTFNLCSDRSNDKVPSKFVRINEETNSNYPKEFKTVTKSITGLSKITPGNVDKIIVENGGINYKIGDTLIVNNRETEGTGASGYVSRILGSTILDYSLLEFQSDGILNKYVHVKTATPHGLAIRDTVYFDFTKNSTIFNQITLQSSEIILNRTTNVKIITPFSSSAIFYYDIENELIYMNSDAITFQADGIKIRTDLIPEILYLIVSGTVYEITTVDYAIIGPQQVNFIIDDTTFRVIRPDNFVEENIDGMFYTTDSINTTGSIYQASISNSGSNYIALPEITGVLSDTGENALLQFDSSNIGRLINFNYSIIGEKFTSNKTIEYNLSIPYVGKVTQNYEIYEVEVLYGGDGYISTDKIKVNNSLNPNYQFSITSNRGTILSVDVIKGGFYLNEVPSLTVDSLTGTGAILKAKIRRKRISANDILKVANLNENNSIKVKYFNFNNSTLEFDLTSGQIEEDDIIYTEDGLPYGRVFNIRKASAFAKSHSYTSIEPKFLNNFGFLNDSTQKILDSNYYQEWSYSLTSPQNIKDWKTQVENNTHASGFKVFGKRLIENRKSRFERTEDIVKSSVVFSAKLWSSENTQVELNLKNSRCNEQYVAVNVIAGFSEGNYVYGATSGAKGKIIKIEENYMELQLLSEVEFELGEYISTVTIDFINGIDEETKSNLLFYTGILQQPFTAYSVSNSNIIPKFIVNLEDELSLYTTEGKFTLLDIYTANSGNFIPLTQGSIPFTPGNKQHLLISVNGVVQNPSDFTLNANIVTLSESLSTASKCFILYRNTLNSLTFTQSNSTTYTINYTPTNTSQLLIFVRGVAQSHLLTDYTLTGNVITLSEPVTGELFGWFINEGTTSQRILAEDLNNRKVLDSRYCSIEKVTTFIESSKIDYDYDQGNSIYEVNKDLIDGTLVALSDNQTIHGFDTKFKVTTPEYSSSYVEVLNPINFNGVSTSYQMTYSDGIAYTPKNGKNSLIVNVNNQILDSTQYNISGSTITFTVVYGSQDYCTISDYISSYSLNDTGVSSAKLDELNISQNGTRKTFNLSYKGVPQYVRNISDIFTIKNNQFLLPDNTSHTVSENKITLTTAPISTDKIQLLYFNRQLGLTANTNLILDPIKKFDGNATTFPLTVDGLLFTPISVYNVYVIRSGVYQRPDIDFTTSSSNIIFSTAPVLGEEIIVFYSYNNLNQNQYITDYIADGTSSTVNLGMTPPNADDLFVLRNGVFQNPLIDFTVAGSILTFTTSLVEDEQIFIMYTTASIKIGVDSYSSNTIILNSTDYTNNINGVPSEIKSLILYVNGVPKLYQKDFTISGTTITLLGPAIDSTSSVFVIKYPNLQFIDDIIYFADGFKTDFRILYNNQNLNPLEILSDADILVSVNGIIQDPGTDYNINPNRTFVSFAVAPVLDSSIIFIKMNGNTHISLTPVSGNTYALSSTLTNEQLSSLVIFSNNSWKLFDAGDFTYSNGNSRVNLNFSHTTGDLFGIIFDGDFKYLDHINTPFNGSNVRFNMFIDQENFIPDLYSSAYPLPSSIIVTKNNKILDPGVDYTLTGTIGSQINFTTAPITSDKIEVRSLGYFNKLDSITSTINGNTTFNLTVNAFTYYPNKVIERPRKYENQIMVIKDGNIQSPLYDYYIDNDKLIFVNPIIGSKLVILDYIGTNNDVKVIDTTYNVDVGDKIQLSGEYSSRKVTEIVTPTILKTQTYTGIKPSGFAGVATVNNTTRKVTSISITSGGTGYSYPVILRTKGIGISAKATASVNLANGSTVTTPVNIEYAGKNVFGSPAVVATTYGYVFKKKELESSSVSISSSLRTNLNNSSEIINVKNVSNFPQNPPSVSIVTLLGMPSGSGAQFRVFVSNNRIRKVEVINGGTGYLEKYTTLTVTGGNGFGCVLIPTINTTTGAITAVSVKNGGEGYDTYKAIIYANTNTISSEVVEYTYRSHVSSELSVTNYIGTGSTTVTGTVASTTGYSVGDVIIINGATGTEESKLNGSWLITSVPNSTTFQFIISSSLASGTYTTDIGITLRNVDSLLGCTRSSSPVSHTVNSKVYSDSYL